MFDFKISGWPIISVLLLLLCVSTLNGLRTQYDFIVVGAGAGGCTVARRLSEQTRFSVLLIESGGNPPEDYDIPALANKAYAHPVDYTFSFTSIPQRNGALQWKGMIKAFSGRMLGGTTSMNGMVVNRGHPSCWDGWANATEDCSWQYKKMLPFMKKFESYAGDYPSAQHEYNGPITVTRPKYAPGLEEYWLMAGNELGLNPPNGNDPNGPQRPGFSPYEFSKKRGRRQDAYTGYIANVSLPNLDVLTNTNVTQILFANDNAVAVRIVSKSPNVPAVIFAKYEIIISAGAYNSPLLLQRSGIGPKNVLEAAKIPVIKDLPVGLNLHDHPMTSITIAINNNSIYVVEDPTRDLNPTSWEYYQKYGDGPYSTDRGVFGQAFLVSSVARSEGYPEWPDIHIVMSHYVQSTLHSGESLIKWFVFLSRPKSRGSIKINPEDPLNGNPTLDFAYLTHPKDVQVMIDAMKYMVQIAEETAAYGKLGARFIPPHLPACQSYEVRSDEYWECFSKQTVSSGCHPAGTNKMGHVNDPTAVVDSELRVIGIGGLRVVDASCFPSLTNANTQGAVYAVAEKAADMILKSWPRR